MTHLNRRQFLKGAGVAGAAGVAMGSSGEAAAVVGREGKTPARAKGGLKTWVFWDLWHLDRAENLEHVQGEAKWQEDATHVHDDLDGLAAWPTVYRDKETGRWRMLYSLRWNPFALAVVESEEGRRWKPLARPEIRPAGEKLAPHHVFTLPSASAGGIYLDPVADDGFPFKAFCRQHGKPVYERAIANPAHRWHKIAKAEGPKKYMSESVTVVSRDGQRWEPRYDLPWALPDWHPEPPVFGFYNRHAGKHMMTVRPGWGDRRVCVQHTTDFRKWSGPELLLQPDALDRDLIELYGMPVFPYGDGYVGLVWAAHFSTSDPSRGFNRHIGPLDGQLAYSYDGIRFTRGLRRPFLKLNPYGKPGGGAIEPSCLVETDDELRIYSGSSRYHHGMSWKARQAGDRRAGAILMHTLRKDGFMSLRSRGAVAFFTTKPLVLLDDTLTMNVRAPLGEVHYQLTDIHRKPLDGFTFDDCVPMRRADSLAWRIRWRQKPLRQALNTAIRLEVKMRHAELFSFRGAYHFIDAQDWKLLEDGKQIDTSLLDF